MKGEAIKNVYNGRDITRIFEKFHNTIIKTEHLFCTDWISSLLNHSPNSPKSEEMNKEDIFEDSDCWQRIMIINIRSLYLTGKSFVNFSHDINLNGLYAGGC